jgi:hypothetical protein
MRRWLPVDELTASPEVLLWHRIFEVAVLRKPYYNPANLGKAGGHVKKKEFVRAIGFAIWRITSH